MVPDRPVLLLGELAVQGDRFLFRPAAARTYEAKRGEDVELAVTFDYREAGRAREDFYAKLTLEAEGVPLMKAERGIRDRPVVSDDTRGLLVVRARFERAGEVPLAFHLEAKTLTGSWSGEGGLDERVFRQSGLVRVSVH